MKILLVHNRYRSTAPSGENRVVDQEAEALAALGHEVSRFERHSDDIEAWSRAKKASLPGRVVWSPEAHRDLAARLRETGPTWSMCTTRSRCSAPPSSMPAGTPPFRSWPPSTTTGWPAPAATSSVTAPSATTARAGFPARPPARLLPGLARGHGPGGAGHARAPAGLAVAGLGLHLHLGGAARPAHRAAPARTGSSSGTT